MQILLLIAVLIVPIQCATELVIERLVLEDNPSICTTGEFEKYKDEKEWPYLIAALTRCYERANYQMDSSKLKDFKIKAAVAAKSLCRYFIRLVFDGNRYNDIRPIWVSLMNFIQQNSIKMICDDWKNVFEEWRIEIDEYYKSDLEQLLIDSFFILLDVQPLYGALPTTLDKTLKHLLETITYSLEKSVGTPSKEEYLAPINSGLENILEESDSQHQVYRLPEGFHKRFINLLFELQGHDIDVIKNFFSRSANIFVMGLKKGDPKIHSKIRSVSVLIPMGYAGERDGTNLLDKYLQYILQMYPSRSSIEAGLEAVGQYAKAGLCNSYYSESMRKNMSIIASIIPKSTGKFEAIKEYMGKNCSQIKEISTQISEVPVIGDVGKLRNIDPMDEDLQLIDTVLTELVDNQDYSKTLARLDSPKLLAKLYRRIQQRQLYKAIGLVKTLITGNVDAFSDSTRSGAFRSLVLWATSNAEYCNNVLQILCGGNTGYCRGIIEKSLRDTIFVKDRMRIRTWADGINQLGKCLAGTNDCRETTLPDCKQNIIKPDIATVLSTIQQLGPEERLTATRSVSPWISVDFLKNQYDPQVFSHIFIGYFKSGTLDMLKQVIALAPTGFAKTEGMEYAAWMVTHCASNSHQPIKIKDTIVINTDKLESSNRPTFEDLCKDGKCVLSESNDSNKLLNSVKSLKQALELNDTTSGPPKLPDILEASETASIADRFVNRLCNYYKSMSGSRPNIRQEFVKNMIDKYIPTIGSKIAFTDQKITTKNIEMCLIHYYAVEKKAQNKDELNARLQEIRNRMHQ